MKDEKDNRWRGLRRTILVLAVGLVALQQHNASAALTWPRQAGVYIASSSEAIPTFPQHLSGYRSENGKDFWGKPFVVRGSIRVL